MGDMHVIYTMRVTCLGRKLSRDSPSSATLSARPATASWPSDSLRPALFACASKASPMVVMPCRPSPILCND